MTQPNSDDVDAVRPLDAFAYHPELRGKITDPLTSFFRTFSIEMLIQRFPQMEVHPNWAYPDEVREGLRARTVADHGTGDLWVFGYGSLMWDPAFRFAEVRRAQVPGYARRFILLDDKGVRGTKDAPGLMAALDRGAGCEGLAFRIAAAHVEAETEILWRREMVGPGYVPTFVTALIDGRPQTALTFVADHDAQMIRPDLSRAQQVRCIAQGAGFLGTSLGYLENIVSQFGLLGIVDAESAGLLQEVEAYLAQSETTSAPNVGSADP